MKKILFIITLFLPIFVKAQVVSVVRDTVRPTNIGAAYTPTFSDAMQNGILTHYVRRGTSNVYDFMPSSKYLRANYGQLSGGNTWYDFQNFLGAIAYSYATNTSYAGTLVAGDNASGQYKVGNVNKTGFGGYWILANNVNEWRSGRAPGGDFVIQRWNGTTWASSITINFTTGAVNINGNVINNGSATYDIGTGTSTTINQDGVTTNGVNGFIYTSPTRSVQFNGNAITIINTTTGEATAMRPNRFSISVGTNELSLSATPTTNNRSQSFQDDNGVIALTKNIPTALRLTTSGNGSSTTISIPHGIASITATSTCVVTAGSLNAANIAYVTTDATNVNIVYSTAPVSGTNNLIYNIYIKP